MTDIERARRVRAHNNNDSLSRKMRTDDDLIDNALAHEVRHLLQETERDNELSLGGPCYAVLLDDINWRVVQIALDAPARVLSRADVLELIHALIDACHDDDGES